MVEWKSAFKRASRAAEQERNGGEEKTTQPGRLRIATTDWAWSNCALSSSVPVAVLPPRPPDSYGEGRGWVGSATADERCSYCCPLLECGRVPRMDCPSSSPMLLGGGELPPPKLTIRFYFLPHSLSYLNYRRQYMNNCFCFISIDYDVPSTTLRGSTFFLYPIVHFAVLITLPSSGSIRVTKLNG